MRATLAGAAFCLAGAANAAAEVAAEALGEEYFIGVWGLGAADECAERNTMSFFESGAWAITNGGGNPVEAIGVWRIDGDRLVVDFSTVGDPWRTQTVASVITDANRVRFELVAPSPSGDTQAILMFRCE